MQEKLNSSLDNVANNSVYSEALLFMDKVLVGERWKEALWGDIREIRLEQVGQESGKGFSMEGIDLTFGLGRKYAIVGGKREIRHRQAAHPIWAGRHRPYPGQRAGAFGAHRYYKGLMQKYSAIIATDGGRMLPVGLWRQWPDDYRHGRREDCGEGRAFCRLYRAVDQ